MGTTGADEDWSSAPRVTLQLAAPRVFAEPEAVLRAPAGSGTEAACPPSAPGGYDLRASLCTVTSHESAGPRPVL